MVSKLTLVVVAAALTCPAQIFKLSKEQLLEVTAKNPYERFDDGRPKVPDAILEKVRGLTVEEVWGVLPGKGYKNQYDGKWQILHPEKKLVGRAVTAMFLPLRPDLNELMLSDMKRLGHRGGAHQWVIDQLKPGDVLVVDLFGKEEGGSVVGDNLATAIKSATVNGGLVVDGAIRDLEGIFPIDMGVYYRHATPSAIAEVTLAGYNTPVNIGPTTVVPGDVVFGDRTGIYFIPPQFVKEIVDRAEETHIHDEWTKAKFLSGRYKSSDLYPRPKDPALLKEYEDYKNKKMGK
ncbi:MAG: dimethylmenaquinone methyltransferase [Bryobacterales bacterium]|nr:dimethylmenaquinone methyltransferase [Bryobacterales bacterium]